MHEVFFFKKASREFFRATVVMHNPAKFRFAALKKQNAQVIQVKSTVIMREMAPIGEMAPG